MGGDLSEKSLIKNFAGNPFLLEYTSGTYHPLSSLPPFFLFLSLYSFIVCISIYNVLIDLFQKDADDQMVATVPVMALGEVSIDPTLPRSAALTQGSLRRVRR